MKILFIGNSFTYFNDMPTAIFEKIAARCGIDVSVSSVTAGGWSLLRFAEAGDDKTAAVDVALSERPDIVILQEQSHTPISAPEKFSEGARLLCERCRAVGAVPYLFATWGYHEGHGKLKLYGTDTADMEMKLRRAYNSVARELGVGVCQVGAAMTYAYLKGAQGLYRPDNYHPDPQGSLIAAVTILATVTGVDISELDLSDFSPYDVPLVKEAVSAALSLEEEQ